MSCTRHSRICARPPTITASPSRPVPARPRDAASAGRALTKGDVLRVYGPIASVETAGGRIGATLRPTTATDIATIAFGLVLALNVAPEMIDPLRQGTDVLTILAVCLVAAVLPAFIASLVGLYVFRMDPTILIGAVAGSRNSTPSLNAIRQQARSTVPSIGYPAPYALTAMIVLIRGCVATLIS